MDKILSFIKPFIHSNLMNIVSFESKHFAVLRGPLYPLISRTFSFPSYICTVMQTLYRNIFLWTCSRSNTVENKSAERPYIVRKTTTRYSFRSNTNSPFTRVIGKPMRKLLLWVVGVEYTRHRSPLTNLFSSVYFRKCAKINRGPLQAVPKRMRKIRVGRQKWRQD